MILEEFIANNNNWKKIIQEKPYCVEVKEDDDYILLKYSQIDSDFSKELVRECRGVILNKENLNVVCRPFKKFFNYGEVYAADIDWNTARIASKIDGSLIKVWFDNVWHISTNGTIDAFKAELSFGTNEFKTFGDIFTKALEKQNIAPYFDNLNKDYTYLFEVVSPYNRIVVPYKEIDAYHIGTIETKTAKEVEVNIGVKKPKEYFFSSLKETVNAANELPYDDEGYVVRDKNYNRIKIKSPEYLAIHRLANNGNVSYKRILELVLINEDSEFLTYFPEYTEAFDEVKEKLNAFLSKVKRDEKEYYRMKFNSRKSLAMWAKNKTLPSALFALEDNKVNNCEEFVRNMRVDNLLKILGMKE